MQSSDSWYWSFSDMNIYTPWLTQDVTIIVGGECTKCTPTKITVEGNSQIVYDGITKHYLYSKKEKEKRPQNTRIIDLSMCNK